MFGLNNIVSIVKEKIHNTFFFFFENPEHPNLIKIREYILIFIIHVITVKLFE